MTRIPVTQYHKPSTTNHKILTELAREFGWKCWYCGREVILSYERIKGAEKLDGHLTASLDHIVPKSIGGPNEMDNYAIACIVCNRAKFTLNASVFIEWLEYIRYSNPNVPILTRL